MPNWEKGVYIDRDFVYRWTEFGRKEVFKVTTPDDRKEFWSRGEGKTVKDKIHQFAEAEMYKCIQDLLNKFKKQKDKDDNIVTAPAQPIRTPTKRALIVGINKYDSALEANLDGCVNDAENMHNLFVNMFGFRPDNIRVLTDYRATKAGILERLNWLVSDLSVGDELVFHYSGHGSQIRDRHGDELEDDLDEILCPTDLNWDDPLLDDDIGRLFRKVPSNVFLTMICDSCHSGTMTRDLMCTCNPHEKDKDTVARYINPPYDIRSRSLGRYLDIRTIGENPNKYVTQNHVLLSACREDQKAADGLIEGKHQGAFTWALTEIIKNDPNITFREAHAQSIKRLSRDFTQIPQLSGSDAILDRKIFGGK